MKLQRVKDLLLLEHGQAGGKFNNNFASGHGFDFLALAFVGCKVVELGLFTRGALDFLYMQEVNYG